MVHLRTVVLTVNVEDQSDDSDDDESDVAGDDFLAPVEAGTAEEIAEKVRERLWRSFRRRPSVTEAEIDATRRYADNIRRDLEFLDFFKYLQ